MIRTTEIDNLVGLVGFRQSTLSGYTATLDTANTTSASGLYVNDVSGLLTTKNIKNCQEDPQISDANFNTFLLNRMKSSFQILLRSVFSDEDLLENAVLYPFENDWNTLLTNSTDFVGYEIDPAKVKDLSVVVNKIMLEFNSAGTVKVLLFHSSKNAALTTKSIITVSKTAVHTVTDWQLNSYGVTGGKFYIGYLRSALTTQAYNRNFHQANRPHRFRTFDIRPVKVTGWDSETLFDVNMVEYTAGTYGMNFDITSFKDFTSYVVENKNRFARALQLQTAADLLNLMSTSTRFNSDERGVKAEALFELNGNRINPELPQSVGVLNQLKDEIKKLKGLFSPPKIQINTLK